MNGIRMMWAGVVLVLCGFLLGIMAGRMKRSGATPEPPRPAIIHKDGSRTLARVNTTPPPALPAPPHTVARVRAEIIELKPMAQRSTIQLDVVRLDDGTERVTAKGEALDGGQDFSIAIPSPPVKKWTLGGGVGFKRYTGIALKSWGPVNAGVVFQRDRHDPRDWDAQVVMVFHF